LVRIWASYIVGSVLMRASLKIEREKKRENEYIPKV